VAEPLADQDVGASDRFRRQRLHDARFDLPGQRVDRQQHREQHAQQVGRVEAGYAEKGERRLTFDERESLSDLLHLRVGEEDARREDDQKCGPAQRRGGGDPAAPGFEQREMSDGPQSRSAHVSA
jgi:hypothetical protein